jgi:collagenase-like PrtC family protease
LLNIYNEDAAAELVARGCVRLCGNVELSLDAMACIHRADPALELERFAFGRMPLALSGRCYHARLRGTPKDACQFACEADPDGLTVSTLEGGSFLALNGVQVMSHGLALPGTSLDALRRAGVGTLRLSPQDMDMAAVATAFRRYCDGLIGADALNRDLLALDPPGDFVDGYSRGLAGWRESAEL